ncbi:Nn.00g069450.m01.CDS01 [Neocucurbitaria sp. VM-36]
MSHHSPQSSPGVGSSSSPFAGTDPTLYSPELVRVPRSGHRRDNTSQVTVIAAGKQAVRDVDHGSDKYKRILPHPAPYIQGTFVNEMSEDDITYISRYQFVSQLPDGTNAGLEVDHELFSVQHQMKLYACFSYCVPYYAQGVYLRHDDLHDAAEAKNILEQHGFTIHYVSGYEFARAKTQDTAKLNEFEGQIKLSIMIQANPDHAIWEFTSEDLVGITKSLELTAAVFGAVRNCVHVSTTDAHMLLNFRIEYHSVDAANRAVESLGIDLIWGMNNSKSLQWCIINPSHWAGERALNSPHRTKPRVDDQGRFVGFRPAPERYGPAAVYHHPHDHHNRVRRERIIDGSDVRTTVMLRNIPNKLDWLSLKTILDKICFGTYDFVYLRIDFKSACNVGYAFINFSDVNGMICLIDRLERRPWVGFHSDKAAEISYATIQGREALIQKFRNSSVMQETPFCRPRLFITYTDAAMMNQLRKASTEQPFPRPDNLSKLQRSMDSARSIGLYPPHGYSSVTEHRNRTSGYDRGTPRDVIQSAMQFAQHRAAPIPFTGLTDIQKRDIETWYSFTCGNGQVGIIPFNYIPMTHVAQYFAENPVLTAPSLPGVIGGKKHSPYKKHSPRGYHASAGNWRSTGDTTPTRGGRMHHTYASPSSAKRVGGLNSNPFN